RPVGGGGRPRTAQGGGARAGARGSRAGARLRHALRLPAPAGALHPPRILDRAAPVGAGKDRPRLRELRAVPPLRPVRRVAVAPRGLGPAARADRAAPASPRGAPPERPPSPSPHHPAITVANMPIVSAE